MSIWKTIFDYDERNGVLLWKKNKPRRPAGSPAGNVRSDGRYITLHATINGVKKRFYAHRIIWEIHFGDIPPGVCTDHIDGNSLNNKVENLRITSLSGNQKNRKLHKSSALGIHGVRATKCGYSIYCDGRYVAHKKDFFEACCVRKSAEARFGYHPNHGRIA